MFVFGEVQDPLPETVRLVEDIVRGQIIEIVGCPGSPILTSMQVTRARHLTHLRSSRFLSAEDLIFLIRDDRGKVNRLRTYLSWKDVRKKTQQDDEGGGDMDVDEAGEGFWAFKSNVAQTRALSKDESPLPSFHGRFSLHSPTSFARCHLSKTAQKTKMMRMKTSCRPTRIVCSA